MAEPSANRVAVTDFDMPFLSMVRFMVKWAIAAIPAVFIITFAAALFWGVLLGALATFGSALTNFKQNIPATAAPDSEGTSQAQGDDEAEEAYLSRVVVSNVRVAPDILDQIGVFGEITNTGDRTLRKVEVTIYCLGEFGRPVFEKRYHPVLVTELPLSADQEPLKPGHSRTFGAKMDDAPLSWTRGVEVKVTSVTFQRDAV